MTPRSFPIALGWLALAAWPLASAAQTQDTPAPLAFKSAFEGYQSYTDEKTVNWKEANNTTARIGGWRAYAKEAAGAEAEKAPQPTQATAPSPKTMPLPSGVKP